MSAYHLIAQYLSVVVAKSSLLLLSAAIITVGMRRRGAAARHLVWIGAILGAALLPVLGAVGPVWNVAVLSAAPALKDEQQIFPFAQDDKQKQILPFVPSVLEGTRFARDDKSFAPADKQKQVPNGAPRGSAHIDSVTVLLLVWAAGALVLLSRIVFSILALRQLQGRATAVDTAEWDRALRAVDGRRRVTLLVSDDIDVPVTWGMLSPVILLPREADEWTQSRRELVLRHELAHVGRHDVASQLLARVVRAIYWPNPLAWLAERKLRHECEQACDDAVIAAGVRPTRYAEELLAIVSELSPRGVASWAPGFASRPSLELRLHALLDARSRRRRATRVDAAFTAVGALALTLPMAAMRPVARQLDNANRAAPAAGVISLAPTLVSTTAPNVVRLVNGPAVPQAHIVLPGFGARAAGELCPSDGSSHSNWTQERQGTKTWDAHWTGKDCAVDLRAEGDVQFNDDLTDIASISRNGFFDLSVRQGDDLTRLVVRSAGQGELDRRYTVNGAERRWDSGAREWFADFLLELDRQTGFAIDTRFPKLLARGVPAVFDEIEHLGGDYVRALYFQRLIERAKLSPSQVRETLQLAGRDLQSDYELARTLIAVSDRYGLNDEDTRAAFLSGVNSLKSDYERNRALMTLLSRSDLSSREASQVLQSASALTSDYELARTLVLMTDKKLISPSLRPLYLDDVAKISNDYERARSTIALLGAGKLTNAEVGRVLGLAGGITNDYERARVLVAVADGYDLGDDARDTYLKAARAISNQYERGRALAALKER